MKTLIDAGLPAEKIVLGLPFYGRDIKSREAMTYDEIVAKLDPEPNADQIGQMYFNGQETIRRKVKLAIEYELGGLMDDMGIGSRLLWSTIANERDPKDDRGRIEVKARVVCSTREVVGDKSE